MAKWVALFSQTGSEIVRLSEALGRAPDLIATNNKQTKIKYNEKLGSLGTVIMTGTHDQLMHYFATTPLYPPEETVITLHGYLRIVTPEVVNRYEIYNGHPALIHLHPELKGKDPQERTWENWILYSTVGSVVHRVNEKVDDGEIVSWVEQENKAINKNDLYRILEYTSGESWLKFLRKRLDENWDKRGSISR